MLALSDPSKTRAAAVHAGLLQPRQPWKPSGLRSTMKRPKECPSNSSSTVTQYPTAAKVAGWTGPGTTCRAVVRVACSTTNIQHRTLHLMNHANTQPVVAEQLLHTEARTTPTTTCRATSTSWRLTVHTPWPSTPVQTAGGTTPAASSQPICTAPRV